MKLASILQVKKILFELDIVNKKFWGENKTIKSGWRITRYKNSRKRTFARFLFYSFLPIR